MLRWLEWEIRHGTTTKTGLLGRKHYETKPVRPNQVINSAVIATRKPSVMPSRFISGRFSARMGKP